MRKEDREKRGGQEVGRGGLVLRRRRSLWPSEPRRREGLGRKGRQRESWFIVGEVGKHGRHASNATPAISFRRTERLMSSRKGLGGRAPRTCGQRLSSQKYKKPMAPLTQLGIREEIRCCPRPELNSRQRVDTPGGKWMK